MTNRLENGRYDKYLGDHDSLATVRETKRLSALIESSAPSVVAIRHSRDSASVPVGGRWGQPGTSTTIRTLAAGHAVGTKTKDTGRRQDDRLVSMYADLNSAHVQMQSRLDCLENEVAFAIKYLKAFWQDNPAASRTLVTRLESALVAVRVKDRK